VPSYFGVPKNAPDPGRSPEGQRIALIRLAAIRSRSYEEGNQSEYASRSQIGSGEPQGARPRFRDFQGKDYASETLPQGGVRKFPGIEWLMKKKCKVMWNVAFVAELTKSFFADIDKVEDREGLEKLRVKYLGCEAGFSRHFCVRSHRFGNSPL
jgi:hypothetical protein